MRAQRRPLMIAGKPAFKRPGNAGYALQVKYTIQIIRGHGIRQGPDFNGFGFPLKIKGYLSQPVFPESQHLFAFFVVNLRAGIKDKGNAVVHILPERHHFMRKVGCVCFVIHIYGKKAVRVIKQISGDFFFAFLGFVGNVFDGPELIIQVAVEHAVHIHEKK